MIEFDKVKEVSISGKQVSEIWQGDNLLWSSQLREGVDYQRYEWLIAIIPVGISMLSLNIQGTTQEFTKIFKAVGNTNLFSTEDGYTYFSQDLINVLKIYYKSTIYLNGTIGKNGRFDIKLSKDKYVVNNVNVPKYSIPKNIGINNASNGVRITNMELSSIKVDGIVKYSPCQLLRPIAAKFASDNIPHPQGECGMIDLVDGKFYGNANTSGSFSVSN